MGNPCCPAVTFASEKMSEKSEIIDLPPPRFDSGYSIEKALLKRRSVRDYASAALNRAEIAQLLWACQGISKSEPWRWGGKDMMISYRTSPSAGALYPLEVYVQVTRAEGLEPGLYHYLPGPGIDKHRLELLEKGDRAAELADSALGQSVVTEAAANVIIAGVVERTAAKYGRRAWRYVLMEVGHAAENLCLQAQSLDVGVVMIGAFVDEEVRRFIGEDVEPFYIISVGKKR